MRNDKIRHIYIMLGSACNFHCKYCLQCDMKHDMKKQVSDKLKKFLWSVACKTQSTPIDILFWGGEPLLYFKQIVEIVNTFGKSFKYIMVSNGSLLTEEIVNFLNDNHIRYVFSNDGKNTATTRIVDVTKNPEIKALLSKIENLSVEATTSSYNIDYNALFDYWNTVLPNAIPNFELLRVTWDMPEELYKFDLDKYRENTERFFNEAVDDLIKGNITKKASVALPFLNIVADGMDGKKRQINCGQTYRNLNVDLDGNIYVCHNTGITIGTVDDNRDKYIKAYQEWLNSKRLKACSDCVVRNYCNGGCPLEPSGKEGLRKTCAINIVFFQCVEKAVKKIAECYRVGLNQ